MRFFYKRKSSNMYSLSLKMTMKVIIAYVGVIAFFENRDFLVVGCVVDTAKSRVLERT